MNLRGKFSPRTRNEAARRRSLRNHPRIEELETRMLLSTTLLSSPASGLIMKPLDILDPAVTPGQAPLTPGEMRAAYGVPKVNFVDGGGNVIPGDGTGQTIAIVDALNDPTIIADLKTFDQVFGLQDPPSFTVLNQNGAAITNQTGTPTTPRNSPHSSWSLEEALDVEWAHVMAPNANIVLFEANSASNANLLTAVQSAAKPSIYAGLGIPTASVISNSYGSNDTAAARTADQAQDTSTYKPISDAGQISLVFSSGDSGVASFPATSPYVLGVGGTRMALQVTGFGVKYVSESTYNDTAVQTSTGVSNFGSSGGGTSAFETIPSYQVNYGITGTHRASPDVSMSGDLFSGVYITDSYDFSTARGLPATTLGTILGTSLAAPMWGGLIAVVNQGRALNGMGPIGNVQEAVYSLPTSDFHDVTTGTNGLTGNNLHTAGPGYDLVTGIGSPVANKLIPALVAFTGNGPVTFVQVVVGGGTGGSSTPADGTTTDGSDGTDDGSGDGDITYTPYSHSTAAAILTASPAAHDLTTAAATATATPSLNLRDLSIATANTVTVALPSSGQVVRTDAAVELTALPYRTAAALEGFHGAAQATLAGSAGETESTDLNLPVEFGLPADGTSTVTTTAAVATPAVATPAPAAFAVTDSVADAAFADFSVVPTLETGAATVVTGTAEEAHSVDLAMVAGLALALGGSWAGFGRTVENRKVPALRS